jgi:short-subunit dehydrogenase
MQLRDRRVLITGASRGIGEALARRFAEAGATVALVARSADSIEKLAADLGGSAHPADLADATQVSTLVHRVEDEAGPVDVLVNNAGVDISQSFTDYTADDIERIYRVNLLSPIELCRQAIPVMLGRGNGHIVNVSSLAGVGVFPGLTAYASTKAGLTHFTAGLRADLKGLPIGTTVVELGPIPTEMLSHVSAYRPTDDSFKRFYRLNLLADVSRETVADEVIGAVEKGRRHVRIPKRSVLFPLLAEAPRRMTEIFLTGVKHQESVAP